MNIREINYKKIAIIAGFIAVCLLLVFFIYKLFFSDDVRDDEGFVGGDIPEWVKNLPDGGVRVDDSVGDGADSFGDDRARKIDTIAQGGLTKVVTVTDARALDPVVTRDGSGVVFYDRQDGMFYRVSADGSSKTLLTDEKFFLVEDITWSPKKDKAVLEYPDGSNIIYDFVKRKSITLPKEVVEPEFAPRSDELAFMTDARNPDDNWIVLSDSRYGSARLIEPVGENIDDVQIAFSPDESIVAMYSSPVGINQEEVIFIGKQGENFKSMVVNGLNFKGKYSPDGSRMLYSVISMTEGFYPSLWVADVRADNIGNNMYDLGVTTWVDKCTFDKSGRIVYCAVPQNLPANSGLSSRAYRTTNDAFYRIDLDTGLKKIIAIPADEDKDLTFAVVDIWLDSSGNNLFFWDAYTEQIFKIRIR